MNDDLRILKHYMAELNLPNNPEPEFYKIIPKQRAFVLKLMEAGVIRSYALSEDRTKLWVVLIGKDKEEVSKALDKFPLRTYFDYSISELMFYNNSKHKLPELSLN